LAQKRSTEARYIKIHPQRKNEMCVAGKFYQGVPHIVMSDNNTSPIHVSLNQIHVPQWLVQQYWLPCKLPYSWITCMNCIFEVAYCPIYCYQCDLHLQSDVNNLIYTHSFQYFTLWKNWRMLEVKSFFQVILQKKYGWLHLQKHFMYSAKKNISLAWKLNF
jgi:hypothetical protein